MLRATGLRCRHLSVVTHAVRAVYFILLPCIPQSAAVVVRLTALCVSCLGPGIYERLFANGAGDARLWPLRVHVDGSRKKQQQISPFIIYAAQAD